MAASTTVKVATQSGAAKDDAFTNAVTEDALKAKLDVLANDPGSAKLYSLVPLGGLASATQVPVVLSGTTALGATISINADGTISYDGSGVAASLQSLAAGESAMDSFEYIIRMANGALSQAKVSVSVGGINDAPTLQSVAAVSILDTAADDTPAAITGKLAGADVDHGAVLAYSLVSGSSAYGTLQLDSNGQYSFTADTDKIDALNAGVNATASFVVNVTDEKGAASAPVTMQFNIVGANDTASISGTSTGATTEDGTAASNGVLSVSDRDSGQSVFADATALAGKYGQFSFDAATGAWNYALNNNAANVQALNGGKHVQDSVTVKSLDGTASRVISIDITGTNDVATISGTAAGSVTEDGQAAANGQLTVTDVDDGEANFGTTTVSATYGDFHFDAASGSWTYALNNNAANVQALNAGKHVQDSLTIASADGSATKLVSVDITGSNDIAVIAGTAAGNVTEDGQAVANGQLTITDIDDGEAAFGTTTVSATYGDFHFDAASGKWSYALNSSAANVQALNGGMQVQDSMSITSADGSATKLISVDITGSNDIAEITGTTTGTVTEDGTLTASGDLSITDLDQGEAAFGTTTFNSTYGSFTFDAGHWNYLLNNSSAAVQGLNAGQTVFDKMTVASKDGSTSQTISVAIQGANEVVVPVPPANPVDEYMVTFGNKAGIHSNSGKVTGNSITGFDSNDILRYSANLTASMEVVNHDTVVHFNHNGTTFDIILVGISNVSANQIVATNG